jgi:hypothetical protein
MDLQQILEHAVRCYPKRTAVVCGTTHLTSQLPILRHRIFTGDGAVPEGFQHCEQLRDDRGFKPDLALQVMERASPPAYGRLLERAAGNV